jgi:hypothetical protein
VPYGEIPIILGMMKANAIPQTYTLV